MEAALSSRKVLRKILALEFYRKHAGFFLVLLFFAAGFLRPYDHYLLMEIALTSWPILGMLILLWLSYWIFCLRYSWLELQQKENRFLFHFRLFPLRNQLLAFTEVMAIQLFPILLYAGCMVLVGIYQHQWFSSLAILLFIVLALSTGTFCALQILRMPGTEVSFNKPILKSAKKTARPTYTLPLFHLFYQQKLSLLLIKTSSALTLLGVAYLYNYSTYDSRFAILAVGISGALNSLLAYQIHGFTNKGLAFSRNLPIPLYKRFLHITALFFLLMLPETLIFFRHFNSWFSHFFLLQVVLLLPALPVLFYAYLFTNAFPIEAFLWRVAAFFLLYYLLIIFGTPASLLATTFFLAAYLVFSKFYFRFEP